MSRWELGTNGLSPEQAYGKYYEGYTQMLKRQGITGEELKARQGEYAKALHKKLYQETSAKAFGRDYGRALAQEGNVARAQNQLRIVEQALADGGTSTTYFGTPEQLRSAAPLGNIAPAATPQSYVATFEKNPTTGKFDVKVNNQVVRTFNSERLAQKYVTSGKAAENYFANFANKPPVAPTSPSPSGTPAGANPEAQRHLDAARRAEQGARFRGTSQEAMNRLYHIGEESDLTRYYREMENQGEIGRHWEKPTPEPGPKPTPEPGPKPTPEPGPKPTPEPGPKPTPKPGPKPTPKPGPKPTPKPGPKKFAGLKKAGKWGLAALAAGALIYGLVKGCSDDKKEEAIAPQPKPEPKPEPKPQPKPDPKPEPTPQPVEPEYGEFGALKGSDYWKYAELELIQEHQGEAGYKPSNSEINTRMFEIMERNNSKIAQDGVHSDPMLMINDKVEINKDLGELIEKAKAELKEANKDKAGYEPTYSEVNRKVRELIAQNK